MVSLEPVRRAPSARLAGVLYLVVIAAGGAALYLHSSLIVSGDAAQTAENIQNAGLGYRIGVAANFLAAVAYLGVIACLGVILAPAGRTLALISVVIGCAACGAAVASMTLAVAPLALIDHAPYLSSFSTEQVEALAYAALRTHGVISNLILALFGFYCLTTGILAASAAFLRRWPGVFLAIAGIAWLSAGFAMLVIPAAAAPIADDLMIVSIVGESLFAVWITITGLDQAKWRAADGKA